MLMRQRGFTLFEVLMTMVLLAIGLLGLANLQSKMHLSDVEAYQRAQAVLLLQDMADRMLANRAAPADYVTAGAYLGHGDAQPDDCTGQPAGVALDQCEWSAALKGAAEARDSAFVGAMIGARGCIEEVQPINAAAGVCQAGLYRVTVAWQGLYPTVEPDSDCAAGLYGDTGLRRVISSTISIGLPQCI